MAGSYKPVDYSRFDHIGSSEDEQEAPVPISFEDLLPTSATLTPGTHYVSVEDGPHHVRVEVLANCIMVKPPSGDLITPCLRLPRIVWDLHQLPGFKFLAHAFRESGLAICDEELAKAAWIHQRTLEWRVVSRLATIKLTSVGPGDAREGHIRSAAIMDAARSFWEASQLAYNLESTDPAHTKPMKLFSLPEGLSKAGEVRWRMWLDAVQSADRSVCQYNEIAPAWNEAHFLAAALSCAGADAASHPGDDPVASVRRRLWEALPTFVPDLYHPLCAAIFEDLTNTAACRLLSEPDWTLEMLEAAVADSLPARQAALDPNGRDCEQEYALSDVHVKALVGERLIARITQPVPQSPGAPERLIPRPGPASIPVVVEWLECAAAGSESLLEGLLAYPLRPRDVALGCAGQVAERLEAVAQLHGGMGLAGSDSLRDLLTLHTVLCEVAPGTPATDQQKQQAAQHMLRAKNWVCSRPRVDVLAAESCSADCGAGTRDGEEAWVSRDILDELAALNLNRVVATGEQLLAESFNPSLDHIVIDAEDLLDTIQDADDFVATLSTPESGLTHTHPVQVSVYTGLVCERGVRMGSGREPRLGFVGERLVLHGLLGALLRSHIQGDNLTEVDDLDATKRECIKSMLYTTLWHWQPDAPPEHLPDGWTAGGQICWILDLYAEGFLPISAFCGDLRESLHMGDLRAVLPCGYPPVVAVNKAVWRQSLHRALQAASAADGAVLQRWRNSLRVKFVPVSAMRGTKFRGSRRGWEPLVPALPRILGGKPIQYSAAPASQACVRAHAFLHSTSTAAFQRRYDEFASLAAAKAAATAAFQREYDDFASLTAAEAAATGAKRKKRNSKKKKKGKGAVAASGSDVVAPSGDAEVRVRLAAEDEVAQVELLEGDSVATAGGEAIEALAVRGREREAAGTRAESMQSGGESVEEQTGKEPDSADEDAAMGFSRLPTSFSMLAEMEDISAPSEKQSVLAELVEGPEVTLAEPELPEPFVRLHAVPSKEPPSRLVPPPAGESSQPEASPPAPGPRTPPSQPVRPTHSPLHAEVADLAAIQPLAHTPPQPYNPNLHSRSKPHVPAPYLPMLVPPSELGG